MARMALMSCDGFPFILVSINNEIFPNFFILNVLSQLNNFSSEKL
jgi:hypothetical protein